MQDRIKKLLENLRCTAGNQEPNKPAFYLDSAPAYGYGRSHPCLGSVPVYGGEVLELLDYIKALEKDRAAIVALTSWLKSVSSLASVDIPVMDSSIDSNFDPRTGDPQIPKA